MSDRGGHVVLVGAGHGHLHVIDRAHELRARGIDVTVVAPREFRYSGLISPVATDVLPPHVGRVDVAALARRNGVEHLDMRVTEVDLASRRVRTDTGRWLSYSAVSWNIGSVSSTGTMEVSDEVVVTKPLTELARLPDRLTQLESRAGERPPRIGIVGAGATGVELAGNLAGRLPAAHITVHGRGDRPLAAPGLPLAARRRALRRLVDRGVGFAMGRPVTAVSPTSVTVEGREIAYDLTLLATGLIAPPLVTDVGLGDRRGIPVRPSLQHPDHPEVFAIGDCSHFLARPLPMLGVYGVRGAPVLLAGLIAFHTGTPQPTYDPQRRALQVLELGAGRGLAVRGRWWSEGHAALRLKRAIDHRWLARYT
jgi:NADH dehydrogenase FAD-containing subunit